MRQKRCQGAKYKEALTLGLMQVQDQHLRMNSSLNLVLRAPCLPHSSPSLLNVTRGERTSLKKGRRLAFSLSTWHTGKDQNYHGEAFRMDLYFRNPASWYWGQSMRTTGTWQEVLLNLTRKQLFWSNMAKDSQATHCWISAQVGSSYGVFRIYCNAKVLLFLCCSHQWLKMVGEQDLGHSCSTNSPPLGNLCSGTPQQLSHMYCSPRVFLPNLTSFPFFFQSIRLASQSEALPADSCTLPFILHKGLPNKSLAHIVMTWHQLLED